MSRNSSAPPASNRSVLILDRIAKRLTPVEAAKRVVEAAIERRIGPPRRLTTVEDILAVMADGSPVVVSAQLPRVAFGQRMPKPGVATNPAGYFSMNGAQPRALMRAVVVIVTYSAKRDAVRFTPSLGRGWGEGGRAWMRLDTLRTLLETGAKAWAPEKGPIP